MRRSRHRPYFQVRRGGAVMANSTQIRIVPTVPIPLDPTFRAKQHDYQRKQRGVGPRGANQNCLCDDGRRGLDIKINKMGQFPADRVGSYMTRFHNLRSAQDRNQSNFCYTTGFNFFSVPGNSEPVSRWRRRSSLRRRAPLAMTLFHGGGTKINRYRLVVAFCFYQSRVCAKGDLSVLIGESTFRGSIPNKWGSCDNCQISQITGREISPVS